MTAYEVTQDLLDATTEAPAAGSGSARPRRRTGLARLRAALTGGVAAGALLLAAPVAAVAQVPAAPAHSAIAAGAAESTLPTTITLTTRRTGSVVQ